MKINTCSKMLWILSVALATGLFSRSANAGQVDYTLTLTEVSSTVLTYTYSNATNPAPFMVMNIGTDIWNITADSSIVLDSTFEYFFAEGASEPGKENNAVKGSANPIFTVHSDLTQEMGDVVVTSGRIGTDGGITILLMFNDLAAASEASNGVPESGSSLCLLALASAALVGLTRLRRHGPGIRAIGASFHY